MDELRYGVIGSGMMGIEHMLNLRLFDDARVTAVADPHEASRGWAKVTAAETGDELELYDFVSDPRQTSNLLSTRADIAARSSAGNRPRTRRAGSRPPHVGGRDGHLQRRRHRRLQRPGLGR